MDRHTITPIADILDASVVAEAVEMAIQMLRGVGQPPGQRRDSAAVELFVRVERGVQSAGVQDDLEQ